MDVDRDFIRREFMRLFCVSANVSRIHALILTAMAAGFVTHGDVAHGQEQSVRPGINDSFETPDVQQFVERFEREGREVYDKRQELVAACQIENGMIVADVGAGTGLFTRLFAEAVGEKGKVYAVDISDEFIEKINRQSDEAETVNIEGIVCAADDAKLPPNTSDVVYICDTYHHFEFPFKTMASIYKALKPGGRVILIDFVREEGVSSDWILNHVRASQETVREEIESVGFRFVRERSDLLKENYWMVFERPAD